MSRVTDDALNGDLGIRVVVDTNEMAWTESPSGKVLRKRLHRVGGAESGQVTSLVRYLPGASFPEHPHPEGEEILVLEGIFSDHSGDAKQGSHLLNPEGFRHAPYSEPGCLIFVKLRQYAGATRPHRRTDSESLAWMPCSLPGIERKVLFDESGFPERTCLERFGPKAAPGPRHFEGGVEIYVISGALSDAEGTYPEGTWLRLPPGATWDAQSQEGCRIYLKEGALSSLRSAGDTD